MNLVTIKEAAKQIGVKDRRIDYFVRNKGVYSEKKGSKIYVDLDEAKRIEQAMKTNKEAGDIKVITHEVPRKKKTKNGSGKVIVIVSDINNLTDVLDKL